MGTDVPGVTSSGGFGQDTTISIKNSGGTPVTALELITSLTNSSPGTEASNWIFKLLTGGAQTTALDIEPGQILIPDGSVSAPSLAFQTHTAMGMHYDSGIAGIAFSMGSVNQFGIFSNTIIIYSSAATLSFGSDQANQIIRSGLTLVFKANATTNITMGASSLGFFGGSAVSKPTVTGSKGANAALTSLMTALSSLGLVTDSTT